MKRLTGPASSIDMPLLCGLGRHKIDRLARWNDGYYFAKCRRCGHDLVRTAYEGWSIPQGFRVVWQAEAPRHARFAQVVADDEEDIVVDSRRHPEANGSAIEFPIRDRREDAGENVGENLGEDVGDDDAVRSDDGAEAQEPIVAPLQERETSEQLVAAGGSAGLHDRHDDAGEGRHPFDHDGFEEEPDETRVEQAEGGDSFMFPSEPAAAEVVVPELEEDDAAEATASELADAEADADADVEAAELEAAEPDPELDVPPVEPPPPPRYGFIPDFMEENPVAPVYDRNTGEIIAPAPIRRARPEAPRETSGNFLSAGWRDLVRQKADADAGAGRPPRRSRVRSVTVDRATRPSAAGRVGRFFYAQKEIAAAALFGGLVLAAAIVDGRNAPAPTVDRAVSESRNETAYPTPSSSTRTPRRAATPASVPVKAEALQPNDLAFVSANLLNCRAVPSSDGATVRRLSRGAEVQVLGAEPGWVSVSHQGQRCWASAQHLSLKKPA